MRDDIEGWLCVPDGHEELIVELFVRDGGKWGEVFRKDGEYLVNFIGEPVVLDAENVVTKIARAVEELKTRLE